jgi:crotonobetaine/carnitine-CoA ligase
VVTSRNTTPYLLTWLALAALGAISVPTNPKTTPGELADLLQQTNPATLISDAGLDTVVQRAMREASGAALLDVNALVGDWKHDRPYPTLVPMGHVTPDDLAVLMPTSGTTGRSKLVMQTHRAYTMAGEGFPHWLGLTGDDRLMTAMPLFHINALAYSVMGSLACGGGLVLLPRFSASGFLDAARRHGATQVNTISAMLEMLMRQPPRPDDADNPLRLCYTGPSPTRQRQEEIERRFGLGIVCGYALSETTYGLVWPRGTRPFGTLGTPRQHPTLGRVNEARVLTEDGRSAGVGEVGELLLRNPAVTPGYWRMPEETARVLHDGWLHSGDLVRVNADGGYTFAGRKKELLRRRGENVSPLEVEQALAEHPAVQDVAVVGVPSDLSEEEIKAFIVPTQGQPLDLAQLRAWVAERLSAHKVPRFWQILDELPQTATARVAKHRLPVGRQPGEYDAERVHRGRPS